MISYGWPDTPEARSREMKRRQALTRKKLLASVADAKHVKPEPSLRDIPPAVIAQARSLQQQGLSATEISKRVNMSRSSIYKYLPGGKRGRRAHQPYQLKQPIVYRAPASDETSLKDRLARILEEVKAITEILGYTSDSE